MALRRLQSHFRKLPQKGELSSSEWYARRARLRAAVFDGQGREPWEYQVPFAASSVATGVIDEVRREGVVLVGGRGAELFCVSPTTVVWLGARASLAALRRGDTVVVRHRTPDATRPGCRLAERIWARTGRVAGTIVEACGSEYLIDAHDPGSHGGRRQRVVIAKASARQIRVRFPRLAPGYLLDVIGTRHHDYLLAVVPATAQPPRTASPTRAQAAPATASLRRQPEGCAVRSGAGSIRPSTRVSKPTGGSRSGTSTSRPSATDACSQTSSRHAGQPGRWSATSSCSLASAPPST